MLQETEQHVTEFSGVYVEEDDTVQNIVTLSDTGTTCHLRYLLH